MFSCPQSQEYGSSGGVWRLEVSRVTAPLIHAGTRPYISLIDRAEPCTPPKPWGRGGGEQVPAPP